MLHDLFTIAVNGRHQGGWILLLPTVYSQVPSVGYLSCLSTDTGYKEPPNYQNDSNCHQNITDKLRMLIVIHGTEK